MFFALLFFLTPSARAQDLIEVPVRKVFFPATGYSDRDAVLIRVEGDLPDPCYELGETTWSRDSSGGFAIHPHAWRQTTDECDTGDLLGDAPYSLDVSLGKLKAGDYPVAFAPDDDSPLAYRKLHIGAASASDTATARAARVTSFDLARVFLEAKPAQVTVRGLLSAPCKRIEDRALISTEGDAVVLTLLEAQGCGAPGNGTYEKTVDLGILAPREYLLQIRGRDGQILDQTFTVVATSAKPR